MKNSNYAGRQAPGGSARAEPNWEQPGAPDEAFLGQRPRFPAPAPAPVESRGGCRGALQWLAAAAAVMACLGVCVSVAVFAAVAKDMPSEEQLASAQLGQSTKIYDRNGGLLYEIFDPNSASGGRHTIIQPEQIPDVLKKATIATEDPTFYTNLGVDPYAVARAVYYDLRYQAPVSGGSGITQQLVKNAVLTPEQTAERKIREAILALLITRRYSKDQILAFYLNTIYYGNLSYGIQAGSQSYFDKDVSKLDLAEASLLAGLPQAPALYDPCQDPEAALERQTHVLELMQKQGYVTDEQISAAEQEMRDRLQSPDFGQRCKAPITMVAPHFVEFVRQQLEARYGPEVVYKGGLQVYTTLDPTLQNIAEEEAKKQIAAIKKNNVTDAAVVATDPQTGEIYAMLGSVDFWDKSIDGQVNVATSLRQPGSSIKPVNYVTAFQKGWTPATPILDISTAFPNGNQPPYVPVNYDGKDHGIVSVRTALANSLNISAVKTLYFSGVRDMIGTAQKLGITTFKDPNRYGLALTLGGGEVKLVELTGAYAAFANQGKCMVDQGRCAPLTPYIKIVDGNGNVVLDNQKNRAKPQQMIDPRLAYEITSILSDNAARTMEFGANSPLKTSRPTFAKTGTTNDFKDNWTLGGTPELVVGVWVGNARNTAMKNVSGITGAAPIWHNVIERAFAEDDNLKKVAPHPFAVPQGLVQATVCNESGLLPTELCPADHRHTEIFLAEQAPKQPDNVWVKLKIDKTNNLLANDNCPADIVEERVFEKMPQDPVMPYDQVVAWANAHGIPQPPQQQSPCTNQLTPPPTEERPPVNAVKIDTPRDGEHLTGRFWVKGTADVPNFASYIVAIGPNDQQFFQLGGANNPVDNGVLAVGDTSQFADGEYLIRLTVVDRDGHSLDDQVQVTIDNTPESPTPRPTRTPRATPTTQPGGGAVGPGTYNFRDPRIDYSGSWQAVGQNWMRSNQRGATASLNVVNATSFSIGTVLDSNRGIANVLVDGNVIASFDGFSPVQRSFTEGPYVLPDSGPHTITLQVTGTKNPASSGAVIAFQNFVVTGAGPMSLVVPAQSPLFSDFAIWLRSGASESS